MASFMSNRTDSESMSDDEWVDVAGPSLYQPVANETWAVADMVNFVKHPHKYHTRLPSTIGLENVNRDDSGMYRILRCKPVKGRYPQANFPSNFEYTHVLMTMCLFHDNCTSTDVRFPDLKDKKSVCDHYRGRSGLWINTTNNRSIRMLKKKTDKQTNKARAFPIGKDYKFQTNNVEPCFVIVGTPYSQGKFLYDKAIRTPPFFVKSKGNGNNQPNTNKRRRKTKELMKLNTDIDSARNEKQSLERKQAHLGFLNQRHEQFMRELRTHVNQLDDGPAKVALLHATRGIVTAEKVCL